VRGERHDLTLRLFEQQRGFGHAGRRPSVFAYNCAISACDKLKLFERSLSLAAEFRLAADADAGVVLGPPDRKTYSAATTAAWKAGDVETALELWKEMKARGVRPSAYNYAAVLQACAAGGPNYLRQALEVFAELEAARKSGGPDTAKAAKGQQGQPTAHKGHAGAKSGQGVAAPSDVSADIVIFNAVLDAVATHPKLSSMFWRQAMQRRVYPKFEHWTGQRGKNGSLDLHSFSEGAAEAAVRWWLDNELPDKLREARDSPGYVHSLTIVTGYGRTRPDHHVTGDLKGRIDAFLLARGIPVLYNGSSILRGHGRWYNPQGSISVDVEALRMIVSMRDAAEAEAAAEAAEQRRLGLEANERLQSTTRWQQSRPSKQSATARPRSGNDRALGRS